MKTSTLLLSSLLVLAACKDPAADKSKAVTGEAQQLTSAAPAAGAVTYTFDNSGSKVNWTGSKVSASHPGSFEKFTGNVKLVDGDPTKSTVTVDIETNSLKTEPEKLVGHLKSGDFFDVEKFPKATFQSTEIKKGGDKGATHTVTGNLSFHGKSKSITFPANITVTGDTVNVNADFSINRKDFGLEYKGMADDLIRDDVAIKLDIHAKKS